MNYPRLTNMHLDVCTVHLSLELRIKILDVAPISALITKLSLRMEHVRTAHKHWLQMNQEKSVNISQVHFHIQGQLPSQILHLN